MHRSILDISDQLLLRDAVKVAIIDPGTNCAVRYSMLNGPARVATTFEQKFFKGTVTGNNAIERFAMMAAFLKNDSKFCSVDLYLLEEQFESNVHLIFGVIVGIIAGLRCDSMTTRVKRGGNVAVESIPWDVYTLPQSIKRSVIGKCKSTDTKDRAIARATEICTAIGDGQTLSLLISGGKIDDIADTVCYEYGLYCTLGCRLVAAQC